MEYIDQILDLPKLIKKYLSEENIDIFCNTIMSLGYHRVTKHDHYLLLVDVLLDDDIACLVNSILKKLNKSQSSIKVIINGRESNIILESYDNNRLIFKELK